jgi:P-type Ca2+ transporter type 2C
VPWRSLPREPMLAAVTMLNREPEMLMGFGAPPDGVDGLTHEAAAARLEQDGPNEVVPSGDRAWWRRLLDPFKDPMVALLLVAAPTYVALGETTDAIIALVALVPIAAVGWVLEWRAEHTLERLRSVLDPTAVVWRSGCNTVVAATDVVRDDVIWLREGDIIPADTEIVDRTVVVVDESSLTGESHPVTKSIDDDPLLYAGTTVLAGRCASRVVTIGAATRYGRIGRLVADTGIVKTPLQRSLTRLVTALGVVAAVFCVAVMLAELLHGDGWGQAVIAGVSLAIAAIPEEFSMVYALYLALGAWRLAGDRALVRRLPGVETLGSTTVICVDKTGTLTAGRLAVSSLVPVPGVDEHDLLVASVLACEPEPYDPLDVALVAFARDRGIDVDELHRARLVSDWPFVADEKYLTHVWSFADGTTRVVAKGSLEGITAHSRADDAQRASLVAEHQRLADLGMRLIAVAAGDANQPANDRSGDEAQLHLVGLIAFDDPVRPGVARALEQCREAGLRVVMITGDHPATAHAVAEGLGLPHGGDDGDRIATGADLDAAATSGTAALDRLVATTNVFARTRPEQKHELVTALRRAGEVVAMTGDGINDAPALRAADIGVAMGERGTEVAREAATIVLLDDNFATIVDAVRGGRRIYDNLSRAFAYLIAFHPPLMLAALVVPLVGRPLLLLPVHLVLLELLLHPVVSLVFEADPADDDVMRRPPRPAGSALGVHALARPWLLGVSLALGVIGAYLGALASDWPVEEARALGFATLLLAQVFLVLGERRPDQAVWRAPLRPTRQLVVALAVVVVVTIGAVEFGPFARMLQLSAFPVGAWSIALAIAAVTTLWLDPWKARLSRRSVR